MKNEKYKLSFLMAAHNEEKLIGLALKRLIQVHNDYSNIEVLIGLDGCTDRTLEICKAFAAKNTFFKIFEMNERKGKQAVIDKLEPHVTGDIVIIHDADWVFVYKSKKELLEFLSLFDNPKIGGIADSCDTEMSKPNFSEIKSLGFLASAWGNHLLMKYYKNKFTKKECGLATYDRAKMKFCPWLDVYRKKALDKTRHKQELRAGDHIERTLRLLDAGYNVASFDNNAWPHFNVTYNEQSIRDLIKQKIRGVVSKGKIQSSYEFKIPLFGFYFLFFSYVVKSSFKVKRWRDFAAIYVYIFAAIYAMIVGKFKERISTKNVWNLRPNR